MSKFRETYVPQQRSKKSKSRTPRRNLAEGEGLKELRDRMLASMEIVHQAALRSSQTSHVDFLVADMEQDGNSDR